MSSDAFKKIIGIGISFTKKEAKKEASINAIENLKNMGYL
jgi:dsRNA-specific ribonuclease